MYSFFNPLPPCLRFWSDNVFRSLSLEFCFAAVSSGNSYWYPSIGLWYSPLFIKNANSSTSRFEDFALGRGLLITNKISFAKCEVLETRSSRDRVTAERCTTWLGSHLDFGFFLAPGTLPYKFRTRNPLCLSRSRGLGREN